MDLALTLVRAVHYAAVILVFGELAFAQLIASPGQRRLAAPVLVGGIVVALASAGVWLGIEARHMSGLAWREALTVDIFRTLLVHTLFGQVWLVRIAALVALASASLPLLRGGDQRVRFAFALAVAFIATAGLAATGHAAGGGARLVADAFHVVAAAAWVGALPPFARAMAASIGRADAASHIEAFEATRRYSLLGIACVGTLMLTGVVNASYSIPTVASLYESAYGRLLLAKVALFAVMLGFAGVNRTRHTAALGQGDAASARASLRALRRNAFVEFALGLAIVAIVAQLGVTMPPMPPAAVHMH